MSIQDRSAVRRTIFSARNAKTTTVRLSAALGAAAALVACGDDGSTGDEAATPSDSVVRTQDHPELGRILVDASGKTLYFADQEADGSIRCLDECLTFWFPARSADGAAPSVPGVTDLDVLRRADSGQSQLTYHGKPLYTFQLDSAAGDVEGNSLEDDFGGTHFVWHAVAVDAEGAAPPPQTPTDGGNGY